MLGPFLGGVCRIRCIMVPAAWCVICLMLAGTSEMLERTLSDRELERIKSEDRLYLLKPEQHTLTAMVIDLKQLFRTATNLPLSREVSKVVPNRSIHIDGFSYTSGMTLREALDGLCAASGGQLHWIQSNGFVILMDTAPEDTTPPLARPISLELEDTSLWFALHAFAKSLLKASPELDHIGFNIPDLDTTGNARAFMLQDGAVTLCMAETPAREVLHEILNQSPVPLFYGYSHQSMDDKKIRAIMMINPNVVTDADRAAYGDRPAFRPREQFIYWIEAARVRRDSVYVAPPE